MAVVFLALTLPPAHTRAATPNDGIDVRLVAQNFNVATNRQLRFVLAVPDESTRAALATDASATLTIAFLSPLTSREEVRASLDDVDAASVAQIVLRFRQLERNAADDFVAITSLIGPLRALEQGVYPVRLQISRGGNVVHSVTTFVNLFEPDAEFDALPVSALVSVDSAPTILPDGRAEVPPSARVQLGLLASLAETFDGPLSIHVAPHVIDGLGRTPSADDQALLARLVAAFPKHELLPATYVSFDAASAHRGDMDEAFTEQLLEGESVIDGVNGEASLERGVWVSRVPVDRDAVTLLRQLGVQTVVLTPQAAAPMGAFDSYVKPYRAPGSSGLAVALRAVDPSHAQWLADQTRDPLINAYGLAAEILLQQHAVVEAGGDPAERHVIVSSPSGGIAALGMINPLVVALDRAPQLRMVPLGSVSSDVVDATNVVLAETDRVDVAMRRDAIDVLRAEVTSTSTMLQSDAPQFRSWKTSLLTVAADTLTDAEFESYQRGLRTQLRSLRNSVSIPDALTFTLGGRESDLRMQLRNEADQGLSVLVTVESAKLQFPNGPQLVAVPARSSIDVIIPVIARANGTFPLEVVLSTPDGATNVGRRIQMTARVSALAGLGQVVTGAAIIILLSWWVSHWRAKRRGDSVKNHPAVH
jgi:hypothetical protein